MNRSRIRRHFDLFWQFLFADEEAMILCSLERSILDPLCYKDVSRKLLRCSLCMWTYLVSVCPEYFL